MSSDSKSLVRRALEAAITFTPWVISMFTLYWLEYGEVWTTETAHRGKISVTILATGMVLSFLVQSRISQRKTK